jgi:hypothetical protein
MDRRTKQLPFLKKWASGCRSVQLLSEPNGGFPAPVIAREL